MSVWKEIRCDRNLEGCWDNLNNGPKGFGSPTELRREGRPSGWQYIDGDDVCPSCCKTERPATVEPEWVDITRIGSAYEEQLDVRAKPGSPNQYRHRIASFSGEPTADWKPSPAPLPSRL